jgi:hypothetical protein
VNYETRTIDAQLERRITRRRVTVQQIKKLKRLICYLKNLKDLTITNMKFKELIYAFGPYHYTNYTYTLLRTNGVFI